MISVRFKPTQKLIETYCVFVCLLLLFFAACAESRGLSPSAIFPMSSNLDQLRLWEGPVYYPLQTGTTGRPESSGYIDSEKYPIRVHRTPGVTSEEALNILAYAEFAWQKEVVEWGWQAPFADNGNGGDDDYDIYVKEIGYGGYIVPEGRVEGIDWEAKITYVVIDPGADADITVAHELNHAFQYSMDARENFPFFERSAVYMQYQVYPEAYNPYGFVSAFQKEPYRSLDWFDYPDHFYYFFGSYIWLQFLGEYLDVNGPAFLAQIWNASKQIGNQNEPDSFDVLQDFACQMGSSLEDWFHEFCVWRYFTGRNDDGRHFSDGSAWGPNGEAYIENSFNSYPVPPTSPCWARQPQEFGVSYMVFYPDGSERVLELNFEGDSSTRWMVGVIGIFADDKGRNDYRRFEMTDNRTGSLAYEDADQYEKLVMVVSNTGDGDHDPDNKDWRQSNFSVSAATREIYTPTPQPTVSPTATEEPQPPTATPAEASTVADIELNATSYGKGDTLELSVEIQHKSAAGCSASLFLAAEFHGVYYFFPSYNTDAGSGRIDVELSPEFRYAGAPVVVHFSDYPPSGTLTWRIALLDESFDLLAYDEASCLLTAGR